MKFLPLYPPPPHAVRADRGFFVQVVAMKKAYARIMLNMAQESAARVLTAERRAVALAASLEAAKEDGVAALLRLKAIMEVRVWLFLSLSARTARFGWVLRECLVFFGFCWCAYDTSSLDWSLEDARFCVLGEVLGLTVSAGLRIVFSCRRMMVVKARFKF